MVSFELSIENPNLLYFFKSKTIYVSGVYDDIGTTFYMVPSVTNVTVPSTGGYPSRFIDFSMSNPTTNVNVIVAGFLKENWNYENSNSYFGGIPNGVTKTHRWYPRFSPQTLGTHKDIPNVLPDALVYMYVKHILESDFVFLELTQRDLFTFETVPTITVI